MRLPVILQKLFISVFFWIRSIPFELKNAALMHLRPSVLSKIIYMADDEMETVKDPDYFVIEKNKDRLIFLYSTTDGWTPITYYERLISKIPDVNVQITDKYEHAFVLKSSHEIAVVVSRWIQSCNDFNSE